MKYTSSILMVSLIWLTGCGLLGDSEQPENKWGRKGRTAEQVRARMEACEGYTANVHPQQKENAIARCMVRGGFQKR